MPLNVAITKMPETQTGKFPEYPKFPKSSKSPQKPLRLSAFLLIGVGALILGYLGFSFVAGKPQINPQTTEEVKEVLGVIEENTEKKTLTFGGLLRDEEESQDKFTTTNHQPPTTNQQPDPALHITKSDLDSFGKILGLKQEYIGRYEVPSEFTITIPALGIKDAKVKTNVDGVNEREYQDSLKQAIAHFRGSALPGELGNVFLFGHSMLPILARDTYLSIFTNLPKLKKGDVIFVEYGNEELRYFVEQTAVVGPKDVFVLRQPQNEELLTLMTCIPPGFGSDRFVAIAKR